MSVCRLCCVLSALCIKLVGNEWQLCTDRIHTVYTISTMYSDDAHPCLTSLVDYPDYDDPFNPRHAEQESRAFYDLLTDMSVVSRVKTDKTKFLIVSD